MSIFPEKLHLTKAGDSVTILVSKCGLATVGTYPEVEFTGKDGDRLVMVAVPRVAADRQLARIPFTYQECVGTTLTIGRAPNAKIPTKPFWDIMLASGGEPQPHHTSAEAEAAYYAGPRAPVRADSASQPTAPASNGSPPDGGQPAKRELSPKDLYLAITKSTLKDVVPLYVEAKIPVSMEAVAAIVATRFITATQGRR